jgi:hypothetical protein
MNPLTNAILGVLFLADQKADTEDFFHRVCMVSRSD